MLNAPFPDFVVELGTGIAEAQYAMDQVSMRILQMMAGYSFTENEEGELTMSSTPDNLFELKTGDGGRSLLSLGFTPTFYQFVDTVLELKMAVSMKREFTSTTKRKSARLAGGFFGFGGGVRAASVNATYSQKYQYSAEGSSLMRTKIVTVPPPALLEEIIRNELVDDQSGTP